MADVATNGNGGGAANGSGGGGGKKRLTKNQKRRLKKKLAKQRAQEAAAQAPAAAKASGGADGGTGSAAAPAAAGSGAGKAADVKKEPGTAGAGDVVIEYVSENPLESFLEQQRALLQTKTEGGDAAGSGGGEAAEDSAATGEGGGEGGEAKADDPVADFAEQFAQVFARFSSAEELVGTAKEGEDQKEGEGEGSDDDMPVDMDESDEDEEDKPAKLSRRQRKKLHRLSVAQLKQLVKRPDVVEAHDVTSSDPRLLVFLKAYRNTVPVPRHWCAKRKYLQGKRGIERPPFELPEFISDTGITKIRDARNEEEEKKTTKQRQRDKMQPKMGKINIDYQILHDAFFKFQTKPKLTQHGDIYYEGKEFEVKMQHKRPGELSEALKQALGMPPGAPPPWLINMQRYGPPPAYPKLKIPGLNAPIPEGASFGYHPGGWGRPPVDEQGRPLYGDVFGTGQEDEVELIDKTRWGEVQPDETDSDESEEESSGEEESDEEQADTGLETPMDGVQTVTSGLSTPATIDLRKGRKGLETPETPQLYQVLESKTAAVGASALMGSSHRYVLPGPGAGAPAGTDSVELEALDDDALKARFLAASGGDGTKSEAGAETEASRKRKRREEKAAAKSNKKAREKFNF